MIYVSWSPNMCCQSEFTVTSITQVAFFTSYRAASPSNICFYTTVTLYLFVIFHAVGSLPG